MISVAKDNNTVATSPVNLTIQQDSQDPKNFPSNVRKINNIGLEGLTTDLTQKIAFLCGPKSYLALRETCKSVNEKLLSPSEMHDKVENGSKGELRESYRGVLIYCQIRKIVRGNEKEEIILALKKCYAGRQELFENCTAVGTRYVIANCDREFDDNGFRKDCVGDSLDRVRRGVKSFTASGSAKYFNPSLYPGELWTSEVDFRDSNLNKESLRDVFSSFNEVYHGTKGSERFVVAHMASKLHNYWKEMPPSKVDKNDLNHISHSFPQLFFTGEIVIDLLR